MYIQKNLGPGKKLLNEHMVMGTATGFYIATSKLTMFLQAGSNNCPYIHLPL